MAVDVELMLDRLGSSYRSTTGRSGAQLNVKECPRCGGRDWKVYLNADSGLGNCFHGSCAGEPGFNPYTFSLHALGTKAEASELMRDVSDDNVWKPMEREASKKFAPRTLDWKLPNSIAINRESGPLPYLADRGFDVDTCAYFGWRYCDDGGFTYIDTKGLPQVQPYSDRVIIPVLDIEGNLVTFQGRDITGTKEKKYLFPPGLPGTAAFLYNAHHAVGKETVILCEGAMDVAATHIAIKDGYGMETMAVVGTFGKHLSIGQGDDQLAQLLKLKRKGAKRAIFLWDGERSTTLAAIDQAIQLSGYGFECLVALLPENKDPNEVEPSQVRVAIHNAVGGSTMALARLKMKVIRHD